ncbi:MAG: linear amide C-N hydrolase [Bacteroidales bacterium]|nr:linear amide C-N hydrolase [Bacteroidales bacterium]
MYKNKAVFYSIAILLFLGTETLACTSFTLRNKTQVLVGKNLDWAIDQGLVIINKKGIAKKAWLNKSEKPMEWVSKYGSITFNQFGKEFPVGGMNEKGLVVEELNFWETSYPSEDKRKAINELQWIQYQLDNAKNIDEVLASDSVLRISKFLFNIHYLITDSQGNTVIIEFYKGKMRHFTNDRYPVSVLANNSYKTSLKSLSYFEEMEDTSKIPQTYSTRFYTTWKMMNAYTDNQSIIDYSFQILEAIKDEKETQWSIVYDIKNLKIYFKTRTQERVKTIAFQSFNFSFKQTSLFFDINHNNDDSIQSHFTPYSNSQNRAFLEHVYKEYVKHHIIEAEKANLTLKKQLKYLDNCCGILIKNEL